MYYNENPNLGIKKVVTVTGETEYRQNCRKIKGQYYVMNKDCFKIGELWIRTDSGLIEKDHKKGTWVLKKYAQLNLAHGVVGFSPEGRAIMGYYTPDPYDNCIIDLDGLKHGAISADMLIQNGYAEDFSTGMFYPPKNIKALQTPRNEVDHTAKGYNLEDNTYEYLNKTKLFSEYKRSLSKDVLSYAKMLGDISFGIEIECAKGYLPDFIQNRTGVVICRDGSLNDGNGKPGPEFVTIPLRGAQGLQNIKDICQELTKRTEIDIKCSLHLHIGNLPTTRMFILSMYKLCSKIQNEMFTMFPYYKTNPEGIKHKNYNQKLPSLSIYSADSSMDKDDFIEYVNSNYKKLFSWLAEGYQPDDRYNRKNKVHPIKDKWGRHSRYYWMNLMNVIFSDRNTIEFRLHTPTTNFQKVLNWLFICNAIVKYANTHAKQILLSRNGITINEILDYYKQYGTRGEFLSRYLNAYVMERKELFYKDYLIGDYISEWEMRKDKEYTFTYENVNYLF